jgi:hypothetical protein
VLLEYHASPYLTCCPQPAQLALPALGKLLVTHVHSLSSLENVTGHMSSNT